MAHITVADLVNDFVRLNKKVDVGSRVDIV